MAPTALISWAHDSDGRAVATYEQARSAADDQWRDTVLGFTQALRVVGDVEADIDVAHASEATDWARWGPGMARTSDFVLAVVNKAWTRRFEGREEPTRGSGAVAEADVLLGIYQSDRSEFARKVIPVVLPGASTDDIPDMLRGTVNWFEVDDFAEQGLGPLLRRIYGKPDVVLQPLRGSTPPLPPSFAFASTPSDGGARPAAVQATPAPLADATDDELADRLAVVRSGLASLPAEAIDGNMSLPWNRAWHQLQGELARLVAESDRRASRPDPRSVAGPADRLDDAVAALRHTRTTWIAVAAVPARPSGDTCVTVARARHALEDWTADAQPVPALDLTTAAHRTSGRVVLTGEPAAPTPGDGTSGRWRIELSDDGSTVVAAALPDEPTATGGSTGWQGQPGEVVIDATISIPVRRDTAETWILTAVELAAHRLTDLPRPTPVDLQARIVLPTNPTPKGHHQPASTTVHVADGPRDPDHPDNPPSRAPGTRNLPHASLAPATATRTAADLRSPAAVVAAARDLARQLLEQFGVEDTAVLRDGTLSPRAAAVPDQQHVHQHALAQGLPVEDPSPAERQAQAQALRDQARELLAPPPA